jgi:hypothetical protein
LGPRIPESPGDVRIKIGQDIRGGAGEQSGGVDGGARRSFLVGHDIVSGSGEGSGFATASTMGDILVLGSLKGSALNRVEVNAMGRIGIEERVEFKIEQREIVVVIELPDGTFVTETRRIDVIVPIVVEVFVNIPARLDNLTVLGKVEHAQILAGVNGSIGSVFVAGDWIASDLAAAVDAGEDGKYGTSDDLLMFDELNPSPGAGRIKQVAIVGRIKGTPAPGDHFGFVAHRIDRFFARLGGGLLNLRLGAGNDDRPLGMTGDVRLREADDEENQPLASGELSSSIISIRR